MRDLKKQERTAIENVARLFSATWKKGSNPPDAYICAGRRIAVDIQPSNGAALAKATPTSLI
jgi:hypothetical protein